MGRASADFSMSGHGTPVRRRRRGVRLRPHRRCSPTPTSIDATSQELARSSSAVSVSQQPSLPYPDDAPGSYFAVAPLPVFRGDPGECPDAHLARFDRVCRANIFPAVTPAAAARIFTASLDDDAALWYDLTTSGDEASPPPPWHAVRAAFLGFFRRPDAADRARAELTSLRQGPGETVNRYHLRMQGTLRRCSDVGAGIPDDALLKAAFVDGLRAEFQDWVVPQQLETLEDAVALALSLERAESVREARRVAKAACAAAGRCSFCDAEGHEEARCEVRVRMKKLWRSSSSSGRGGGAVAAKDGERAEEEGGGSTALERLASAVSTQCQCRKHQCGKKAVAPSEITGGGDVDGVVWDD
ncbi:hypothetical protein PAHAL_5G517000 [Panicum hallii]|jgi:hypothetical protein|uniref:Retrotransposon gag domain-containing protein n=1 Tax=Panicum hallii TaxID=206008 RepID=A0A2T8IP86_9POAL|nr:hypothetical protein PAHAL_5G517000 [Panicum hallii]